MVTTDLNIPQGSSARKSPSDPVADHHYAMINREAAAILSPDDKIVFAPLEDFEYKAPLEDFKRSQKKKSSS
ncbi:MAG TPA: hypothetical protein VJJ02_02480 [Candidatus Paceibacterota bacterium]